MIEIIGAVVHVNQNYQLMKEAGITWLRHGFSWPWEADGKTLRPQYLQAKARAKELTDMGFKLFGVVGSIGSSRYDPKTKLTTYTLDCRTNSAKTCLDSVDVAMEGLRKVADSSLVVAQCVKNCLVQMVLVNSVLKSCNSA